MKDTEDAKECVNDTYLKTWNSIPPKRPAYFFAYVAKICRCLCFDKLDYQNAKKRKFDIITLSDERMTCILDQLVLVPFEQQVIGDVLTSFLRTLSEEKRLVFMRRYWFSDSIAEIAKVFAFFK